MVSNWKRVCVRIKIDQAHTDSTTSASEGHDEDISAMNLSTDDCESKDFGKNGKSGILNYLKLNILE